MKLKNILYIKISILLILIIPVHHIMSQSLNPVGLFDHHQDVGDPKLKGNVEYNEEDQTYVLSGAGKNMWANEDQFHFAWKKIKGDFIIKATVRFFGEGVDGHRKIGIMAREDLTKNSKYADASVHGGLPLLTALQFRTNDGDTTGQLILSSIHPTEIELERSGNKFTFSAAVFGEDYKSVSKELDLSDEIFAGLFICSHAEGIVEKAIFSNVRIIIPAAKNFVPYRDYIGSNLELMDVETGQRKILYTSPKSLQAPNWTPDNNYLIYSSEGLLYKYDLKTAAISQINTGKINDNNNDHVLSFDGSMLGISNHLGDKSTIYILPVGGSDKPIQITQESWGPSYLHSWSPDMKRLIFTGKRNGVYNIWSIDVESKKETPLTDNPTLDDGPEFSPDGKYIYFNSMRTGTMQLWRMKADGSDEKQVTWDKYNDWFPHFSPDGKWIVYISFPEEIDPADHPFYKKVYLRLMPSSGGVPKTIAYVYGGQGTINVPSWSPDSKKIAFISNTKIE